MNKPRWLIGLCAAAVLWPAALASAASLPVNDKARLFSPAARKQASQDLEALKQEYRVALILREIEELSYEEIAETLGVSIGTVKSRIARGREDLRRRVKDLI